MAARPVVLIAEPYAPVRLLIVDALRENWEVQPLTEADDPLRTTRRVRPAVLLLAVPPGGAQGALRACRSLKTEANPPKVGLLDLGGRIDDPADAIQSFLADGVIVGRFDADTVRRFVSDMVTGARPIVRGRVSRGLLDRLIGR